MSNEGLRIGLKSAPVILENKFAKAEKNEIMLNFGPKKENWDVKNTTYGLKHFLVTSILLISVTSFFIIHT